MRNENVESQPTAKGCCVKTKNLKNDNLKEAIPNSVPQNLDKTEQLFDKTGETLNEYVRHSTSSSLDLSTKLPPLTSSLVSTIARTPRPLPRLKLPKINDDKNSEVVMDTSKKRKKIDKEMKPTFELNDFLKSPKYEKQDFPEAGDSPRKEEEEEGNKIDLDESGSILWPQANDNTLSHRSALTPPMENYSYQHSSANGFYKKNEKSEKL